MPRTSSYITEGDAADAGVKDSHLRRGKTTRRRPSSMYVAEESDRSRLDALYKNRGSWGIIDPRRVSAMAVWDDAGGARRRLRLAGRRCGGRRAAASPAGAQGRPARPRGAPTAHGEGDECDDADPDGAARPLGTGPDGGLSGRMLHLRMLGTRNGTSMGC